jgi:hypothetical protein
MYYLPKTIFYFTSQKIQYIKMKTFPITPVQSKPISPKPNSKVTNQLSDIQDIDLD